MVVYAVQSLRRVCRKVQTNGQHPGYFLAAAIARFINIKFHHQAKNHGKYADGFHDSLIDNEDRHIPSPLTMFTCTTLHHALIELQKNNGFHPQAFNSQVNADRPDLSNCFNWKHAGSKSASCCAAMGHRLLTSPGITDTYTFLMNTWNALQVSYQQRVYNNSLTTVKRKNKQAENPTPDVVISAQSARVDKGILLDYLSSEAALEDPESRSTERNMPIDINLTNDELDFGIPGGSENCDNQGDESDVRDAIPIASQRQRPATEHNRVDLQISDVDGYECEDGDKADGGEEEEVSQADDRSMQNVED